MTNEQILACLAVMGWECLDPRGLQWRHSQMNVYVGRGYRGSDVVDESGMWYHDGILGAGDAETEQPVLVSPGTLQGLLAYIHAKVLQ